MDDPLDSARLDRSALRVTTLDQQGNDREYWMSRTPWERIQAVEMLRIMHYGYDPTTERLQRVLRVVRLGED